MSFFDYARDFYSSYWLPQKLAWEMGLALIFLVIAFAGFHLLRRGLGAPLPRDEGAPPPAGVAAFERWELGARLYHWGNFLIISGLLLSGAAFFFPGMVLGLQPLVGFSWLLLHVILAGLFIVGIILHIIFAILRSNVSDMWFERRDWRDMRLIARYYVGASDSIPKYGKYDVWQKLYHAFITLLAIVMIGTGVSLFISSEILDTLGANWMRNQRLIHDIGAFLYVAAIIGHIYMRLVKLNWPKLVAMVTGRLSASDFRKAHDWNRWRPKPEGEVAAAPGEDD
jgi:formate dehydrogenase gamma subunit